MKNIDKNAVHADLLAAYGPVCTRENFAAYAAKSGVDPRWIYYSPAAKAQYRVSRGLFRVPGADDASVAAAIVALGATASTPSTPKAPKAPKASRPRIAKSLAAPVRDVESAPVATSIVSTSTDSETSLSFTVTENQSKADILLRIQQLTREASALASIPAKSPSFVAFGDYDIVRTILASRQFHPIFITGLSGNGKTFQIQQGCAAERREYLRVNITAETDEDDLIGGFRLKNGETVFELGPVVVAMLRGAVLLIDEIDLASPKILCLQSIMEGGSLVIKKLGITITPAQGFTIFATANTKGRGSADGKFVGANLLNEAFLERFPITIEQSYPSVATEKKILTKTYEELGGQNDAQSLAFFDRLAKWADGIRATYFEEGIDDLISTRRLVHIVKTFSIFKDEQRSVALCLNRFDKSVQSQFLDLYAKLTPEPEIAPNTLTDAAPAPAASDAPVTTDNDIPF